MRLSSALWKNGGSDPDAVWHHRSDGDFTAYVCDTASTVEAAVWGGACGGPVGPHNERPTPDKYNDCNVKNTIDIE